MPRLSNRLLSLSIRMIHALTFMLIPAQCAPRIIRDNISFLTEHKCIQITRSSPLLPQIGRTSPKVGHRCRNMRTRTHSNLSRMDTEFTYPVVTLHHQQPAIPNHRFNLPLLHRTARAPPLGTL